MPGWVVDPMAPRGGRWYSRTVTLGTLFLILLILMVIGSVPTWPHSRNWGYYPSSGLGLVLVILILLIVTNRI
jgi:hypothetical protein